MTRANPLPRLPFLIALACLACSRGDGAAPAAVVRDSAGITIVESTRPAWGEGEGWRVAADPTVVIGMTEGDPNYLFGSVEGAVRLDDGTIVVADGQAMEIRFFGPSGRFVRSVGRSGEGPGEFSRIGDLRKCGGDRIYADDWLAVRTTIFEPDGTLHRMVQVFEPGRELGRRPYLQRCSATGAFVAAGWGEHPDFQRMPTSAFYRQEAPVWVLDSIGQQVASLGQHLVSERIFLRGSSGGGTSGPHPFGRQASVAIGEDRAYLGTGEAMEVREFTLDGTRQRILRGPAEDLTMSDEVLALYLDQDSAGSHTYLLRGIQEAGVELPRQLPAFSDMLLDPAGHLWVRRFQYPWVEVERWGVFSPAGSFLGHVEMPAGLKVREIGEDYVLGVALDELEVERVALYPLERGT